MRCKNCGRSDIPDGSTFCNFCGKRLIAKPKNEINVPKPRQMTSGKWYIYMRIKGEQISVTEDTEAKCIAKAQAIKAGLLKADSSKAITLATALDHYIQSKSNVLSPATIRGYQTIRSTRFKSAMGIDITTASDKRWQSVVNSEARLCSPKTLKNAWRLCATAMIHETGSCPRVTLPQVPKKEVQFLNADEIIALCAELEGDIAEIPCLLALHSLRRSEILGLTWDKINLSANTVRVSGALVQDAEKQWVYKDTTKNSTSTRTVPIMIPRLHETLSAAQGEDGERVVTCSPTTIRRRLESACQAAGVPQVSIHGLRHSFASLAAHIGMPIDVAQRIGGWADDKIMKRIYTHVYDSDVEKGQNDMAKWYAERMQTESKM